MCIRDSGGPAGPGSPFGPGGPAVPEEQPRSSAARTQAVRSARIPRTYRIRLSTDSPKSASASATDLVEVVQEVARVGEDSVRPRSLELLLPVATREQPDPESPRPARGEHVPDRVAHDGRVLGIHSCLLY